jgi:hypothetical protein
MPDVVNDWLDLLNGPGLGFSQDSLMRMDTMRTEYISLDSIFLLCFLRIRIDSHRGGYFTSDVNVAYIDRNGAGVWHLSI